MKNLVAPANAQIAVEHHVRADPATLAEHDLRSDDAVRPDLHIGGQARARRDQRRGVNSRTHSRAAFTEHRIVACATTWPETRAGQGNLPIPRSSRSRPTSISSWSPGTTGRLKRALSIPT